jgi:uncharacterized protein YutE (UPF0331/DUF86 family)
MTPGAISSTVVADKIEAIRRMLDGIRSLPLESIAAFTDDRRTAAAAESYLRRALEALFDLARHVLAKGFGRAPAEYAEVARSVGEIGVVPVSMANRLVEMARYRNRMVHSYDEVTEEELYAIVTRELTDLEDAVSAIKSWLDSHPEQLINPSVF